VRPRRDDLADLLLAAAAQALEVVPKIVGHLEELEGHRELPGRIGAPDRGLFVPVVDPTADDVEDEFCPWGVVMALQHHSHLPQSLERDAAA
jgi:hypothetical protein